MIVDRDFKYRVKQMFKAGLDAKNIKKELESDSSVANRVEVYYYTSDTNDRYYATRKPLDSSFDEKTILNSVTDTGIQKILLAHLSRCDNDPELAFSPDGIDRMNRDIVQLNDGRYHQPIYKVRKYEKADKFAVGQTGNKRTKYVEAAKGTNLYFAIYRTEKIDKETGETILGRSFETIPLNVVVERLKQHLKPVPEVNENGDKLLFWLSPNDLVYVPTADEIESGRISEPIDKERIYKIVSCTGVKSHYVPYYVATPIVDKLEFSSMNKIGRALTGEMIKDVCLPVLINRLGELDYKT
jgi:CRISPR-associated endonuclease Csn1